MKPLDIQATLDLLLVIAAYPFILVGCFYILWILYLAVMNLKRVKDAGKLSKMALILGYPVLFLGLVVDLICNILLSVPLLEMPQEATVTARLKRHNAGPDGWKKSVALWFEPILDPFDPSGDHI